MRTKIKSGELLKQIALEKAEILGLDRIQSLIFANGFMQGYGLLANEAIENELSVLTEDKG